MLDRDADVRHVFFFQAEDGIRDYKVTGVQTCALPISQSEYKPGPETCLAGRGLVSGRRREQGRDLLRERDALVEHAVQNLRPEATRLEQIGRASCRERV